MYSMCNPSCEPQGGIIVLNMKLEQNVFALKFFLPSDYSPALRMSIFITDFKQQQSHTFYWSSFNASAT